MSESETGFRIVLIIIALAALVVLFLVIFARRQIERFKQRSKYGPYVPVGTGAPKSLKREINRRLDVVEKITYEPMLLATNGEPVFPRVSKSTGLRMKVLDDLKNLENEIELIDSAAKRHPGKNVRTFLVSLLNTTLWGAPQRLVHELCDLYEKARHSSDDFTEEDLARYRSLTMRIQEIARSHRSKSGRPTTHESTIRFKSQTATNNV